MGEQPTVIASFGGFDVGIEEFQSLGSGSFGGESEWRQVQEEQKSECNAVVRLYGGPVHGRTMRKWRRVCNALKVNLGDSEINP